MEIAETISRFVQVSLPKVAPHLREWAEAHLVSPRKQEFASDPDGNETTQLWLVTDHNGNNDSSCRIVFDDEESMFGLEMTLQDGTNWFMRLYGSFDQTVESM